MTCSHEWQPIDSAPKDGTSILIHLPNSSAFFITQASWFDHSWSNLNGSHVGGWETPEGIDGRGYFLMPCMVTHWMPLPEPPEVVWPEWSDAG